MSCKLRKNSKSGEILPNLVTLIADHFSCKKKTSKSMWKIVVLCEQRTRERSKANFDSKGLNRLLERTSLNSNKVMLSPT